MSEPLIVFVCTANICRSPWAELRGALALEGFRVASGGIMPAMLGHPMDETMAGTLPDGTDSGRHRAKLVSREVAREASLILTMEQRHRLWLVDEYPFAIRKIFTLGQFAEIVRSAPRGLGFDELVLWAYRNRGPSSTQTDISDPYRQGPQRAAETAEVLDQLIGEVADVLVPSLEVS